MEGYLEKIEELKNSFEQEANLFKKAPDGEKAENLRLAWLGRKGKITAFFEELRHAPKDLRPKLGRSLNELRNSVEESIGRLKELAFKADLQKKIDKSPIDVTLPVSPLLSPGGLHPVTLVRKQMCDIFRRCGFTTFDGPEIDHDFYNFTALNIPENHPSRDMQDTFFIKDKPNLVLRTHTSNIQIHAMLREKPPLRLICPGRVYRVDNDATHTPMFHQMECVVVDKGISMAHLKGMIQLFMNELFGTKIKTRFRPSYFPFVEPGAEVDIWSPRGWLEVGGCGMIDPNVFESVNYDSEEYTGYAFGFGLDRMAMLLYELNDLRQMFEGDSHYHKKFPIYR